MQEFGIGDEELEEGMGGTGGLGGLNRTDTVDRLRDMPQGRLSRELEGGFISDSSDEG